MPFATAMTVAGKMADVAEEGAETLITSAPVPDDAGDKAQQPMDQQELVGEAVEQKDAGDKVQQPLDQQELAGEAVEQAEQKEQMEQQEVLAAGADEQEEGTASRRIPRKSLRARVLAEHGDVSPAEAMAQISSRLLSHDRLVAEAKAQEAQAAAAAEAVAEEARAAAAEVQLAEQLEVEAFASLKLIKKRRHEASSATTQRRRELQERQDMLVLVELEFSRSRRGADASVAEQDAKRQRIEELERVVEDSRRQMEEFRQREREAKEAMKALVKEQKQLTRIGPFGRRTRASWSKAVTDVEAGAVEPAAPAEPEPTALVVVKREIMQAFPKRSEQIPAPALVSIEIEDSQ